MNACISVHMELGIDVLLEKIWDALGIVRVYTKRKGAQPDFVDPMILSEGRHGLTVASAIQGIHRSLLEEF